MTNSTISSNTTSDTTAAGWRTFGGTVTLVRTLVTGNTAPTGPEIFNNVTGGTVLADNHNLFGVNGTAGVEGFTPGATDIVPPAGVQLADILEPTLAFNGGFTQTHALVPGSPAIDAGGPACLDATGDPLLTDQRDKPRVVDGNGDGRPGVTSGPSRTFPLINEVVMLDQHWKRPLIPRRSRTVRRGTFTITATFTNTSDTPLRFPFFTVTELSGDNLLLNADEGAMGVGATVPLVVEGEVSGARRRRWRSSLSLASTREAPFRFFVDLFAEPLP